MHARPSNKEEKRMDLESGESGSLERAAGRRTSGDAMESNGSTMQELYGTVLSVVTLDGSMKLQRWKVETRMAAANDSLRDGERRASTKSADEG
jgi:hypothetical protein